MIDSWPASLVHEWMQYEQLEPFGAWRDNFHAAMLASILANAHRDPKRKPFSMADFFYKDPDSAAEDRDAEILGWFESRVKDG